MNYCTTHAKRSECHWFRKDPEVCELCAFSVEVGFTYICGYTSANIVVRNNAFRDEQSAKSFCKHYNDKHIDCRVLVFYDGNCIENCKASDIWDLN